MHRKRSDVQAFAGSCSVCCDTQDGYYSNWASQPCAQLEVGICGSCLRSQCWCFKIRREKLSSRDEMSGLQASRKSNSFRRFFRGSNHPSSAATRSTLPNVNITITQAYTAVLGHKRACEAKRWQWTFRGRTIVLREEADKVISWLNRFKSVVDVAANADAIHVGLPWTGIRILLELIGCKQMFDDHDEWVNGVAFSPSGEVVACVSGDGTIRLWDTTSDEIAQKLQGHDGPVLAVAIAPGGRVLASASEDQSIILWDAATGEAQQKLQRHGDAVWALAFSSDGHMLASTSSDQTIRLWDTMTNEESGRITGYDDWINALAFFPDGQVLVTVSDKAEVQLWRVADCQELSDVQLVRAIRDASSGSGRVPLESAVQAVFHELHMPLTTERVNQEHVLSLTEQWIQYQGEDLIWLPHGFRGRCTASHDDLLAMDQSSGRVSLFRFGFTLT
nr:vegetative incompatibility protein het-e-1 [Quercus suber]